MHQSVEHEKKPGLKVEQPRPINSRLLRALLKVLTVQTVRKIT
jgi:hypothetical protein